ncbi:MAG: HAD family hydrolase [Myxococcota bacterium]
MHADRKVCREPEFRIGPYEVLRRPHLDEFLEGALARFDVGIWTASSRDYARPVVDWLGVTERLSFLWCRDRCTVAFDYVTYERVRMKPIKKLIRAGFGPKERILYVDDSPEKIQRSYGNYIRIAPYEGAGNDEELVHLLAYLDELGPVPNVRTIEKRGWRLRFS